MWIRPRRDSSTNAGAHREQHFSLHSHHIYNSLCATADGLEKRSIPTSVTHECSRSFLYSQELRGHDREIKSVLNSVVEFVQLCQCTHIKSISIEMTVRFLTAASRTHLLLFSNPAYTYIEIFLSSNKAAIHQVDAEYFNKHKMLDLLPKNGS